MKLPFYIAKRYLFAKKSHNIINIISLISLAAISIGVAALVIVLSVFNGFDSLIKQMYSSIDADIRILPAEGKTFSTASETFNNLRTSSGVYVFSEVLEENALFGYGSKKHIGTIKGVSRNYQHLTGIDTMVCDGTFNLWRGSQPLAIVGRGVAYYLNLGLANFEPLTIYVPKRSKQVLSMEAAFERQAITPSGVFAVEQDFDVQYIIAPVEFVRKLLSYDSTVVSAIEIKVAKGHNPETLKREVEASLGSDFKVQDRFQQNESLYRTMKTEKLVIGLILVLILFIATFNIVGTLSMLIIEKRSDVETLRSLGADSTMIQKIFLTEGLLITIGGSIIGTVVGLLLCWAQIAFKLIRLDNRGNFIIDAYPISIQPLDITIILLIVITIGYICALIPVKIISKRIIAPSTTT